jgi:hypothetical protein
MQRHEKSPHFCPKTDPGSSGLTWTSFGFGVKLQSAIDIAQLQFDVEFFKCERRIEPLDYNGRPTPIISTRMKMHLGNLGIDKKDIVQRIERLIFLQLDRDVHCTGRRRQNFDRSWGIILNAEFWNRGAFAPRCPFPRAVEIKRSWRLAASLTP